MNANSSFLKTKEMVLIGVFTALVSVISIIPIPFNILGVPLTLQVFAMAYAGYVLGAKNGAFTALIYLLIGLTGIPVFNGFRGGFSVVFGVTGGFIFGFILISFLTGLSNRFKNIPLKIILSLSGLLLCHLLGILQFSLFTDNSFFQSLLLVSLPYLPKDMLLLIVAFICAEATKKCLPKN